jgi:hypothetical protein
MYVDHRYTKAKQTQTKKKVCATTKVRDNDFRMLFYMENRFNWIIAKRDFNFFFFGLENFKSFQFVMVTIQFGLDLVPMKGAILVVACLWWVWVMNWTSSHESHHQVQAMWRRPTDRPIDINMEWFTQLPVRIKRAWV